MTFSSLKLVQIIGILSELGVKLFYNPVHICPLRSVHGTAVPQRQ